MKLCATFIFFSLLACIFLKITFVNSKLLYNNNLHKDHIYSKLVIKCMKDIIAKYAQAKTLMLWTRYTDDPHFAQFLFKSGFEIAVNIHSQVISNEPYKQLYIVFKYPEDLPKFYDFLVNVTKGSYFILLWPRTTTPRMMAKILDYFYRNSILNVIGLMPNSKGNVGIYTYFPYTEEECGTKVVKVDEYTWAGFRTNFNLFSGLERLKNFHGCSINTFGTSQAPESFMTPSVNNSWTVQGNIVHYLDTFQQKYNMTLTYFNLNNDTEGWFFYDSSFEVFKQKIVEERIQFGFGNFYLLDSIMKRTVLHYSFTYNPECISFAVPLSAGSTDTIFTVYLVEFTMKVWFCILAALFLSAGFVIITNKVEGKQDIIINILVKLAVSLFAGCKGLKSSLVSVKVFVWFWSFFALIIYCSYLSALGSFMTLDDPPKNIKSYKDIVDKKIHIVSARNMYTLMQGVQGSEEEVKYFLDSFEILPPGGSMELFQKIFTERNVAAFFPFRYSMFYSNRVADKLRYPLRNAVFIIPDCFFSTVSTPLVTVRGSIIYNIMDVYSQQIFESGLNFHWRSQYVVTDLKMPEIPLPLSLEKIMGMLVIYFCGIGLATIVFLLELFKGKLDQKKRMKMKSQRNLRRVTFYIE